MKPWMSQSRRAQTGTAAPITTSYVVALDDIVYGGGSSHGGGYWYKTPDQRLVTDRTTYDTKIGQGQPVGEATSPFTWVDGYSTRLSGAGNVNIEAGSTPPIWPLAGLVGIVANDGGNGSAGSIHLQAANLYLGPYNGGQSGSINISLGKEPAALKLTKVQTSLPDALLMGKYIGIGDYDTTGSNSYSETCNKFTVHCMDDNAAPEILLRTWSIAGDSSSTVTLQAEAVSEDNAEFFAGVGWQPGQSRAPTTKLYGIRAVKTGTIKEPNSTGHVYLQLDSQQYEFIAPTSGTTKTFIIPHPLDNLRDSTELLHSCVEAPTVDNIYRGSCRLMNGKGIVNLDSNDRYQMTQGTFQALNKDPQVHITNNESFDRVRGEIVGNELHIICENPDINANIAWLVIGTRRDPSIRECPKTDNMGNLITERPRN